MSIDFSLVLDTSIIYKWFIEEEYSNQALEIRNLVASSKYSVLIPDLLIYELSNELRYNTDYSNDEIKKAIRSLYDMEIDIVAPVIEILESAIDIAREYDITIYDAYYLSLTKEIGYHFITADKRLVDKVSSLDFVLFLENPS